MGAHSGRDRISDLLSNVSPTPGEVQREGLQLSSFLQAEPIGLRSPFDNQEIPPDLSGHCRGRLIGRPAPSSLRIAPRAVVRDDREWSAKRKRIPHRLPGQQGSITIPSGDSCHKSTMSRGGQLCLRRESCDEDRSATSLGNTELFRAQHAKVAVVSDSFQNFGIRRPDRKNSWHLLQDHGFERPLGLARIQNPTQRFQDQSGALVGELTEGSTDVVPDRHPLDERQDLLKISAPRPVTRDREGLTRGAARQNVRPGELPGPVIAHVPS